jgi:hypothetical protein
MRAAEAIVMATPQNLKSTDPDTINVEPTELEHATGGMKWQGRPESYNVEDRRPGAPPLALQPALTWWRNLGKKG